MSHAHLLAAAIRWNFALQVLTTLAMFGLIWFVQLVHYPLFLRVGEGDFIRYEQEHAFRTGFLVAPLMVGELISSLLLMVPALRPPEVTSRATWVGAGLVVLLWISTAAVQIPLHNRLHKTCSRDAIRGLVRTNWFRTAAWTLRTGLVLTWVLARLRP